MPTIVVSILMFDQEVGAIIGLSRKLCITPYDHKFIPALTAAT